MTARDDVTRAAERLTQQDRSPFTPSRLIAEARNGGSTCSDMTLQTHIVNTMCGLIEQQLIRRQATRS